MNDIVKAISMVGNHVVEMSKDPAKIGENFMPISTMAGLAGASAVAASAGGSEYLDIHGLIGGWESNQQIAMHVIVYIGQALLTAYSAYLVGKPRGASIDDE